MSNLQLKQQEPEPELDLEEPPQAGTATAVIRLEAWDTLYPEILALFEEHFEEVDGGVERRRRCLPDVARMRAMNFMGVMPIISARQDGVLVGYSTWTIFPDVESMGLIIAQQGAWFVTKKIRPGNLGFRLFEMGIAQLKVMGVQNVYLHHRLQGRGIRLGKFFESYGAKEIQHTYSLWIGE